MGYFLEERLPIAIKYGASYSDEFMVEVVKTTNKKEYRRLIDPFPLRTFNFAYDIRAAALYDTVANLYWKVYGKFIGFRAKCLDDFTTNDGVAAPTKDDQPLLYRSSGVYQLVKYYGALGIPSAIGLPYRILHKPVSGTVLIAKNGSLLSSGVTVNYATGEVTISPAPSHPADVITGGCEFDIPVRFDGALTVTHDRIDYRDVAELSLVELIAP